MTIAREWFRLGILLEDDLAEIQKAIDEKNIISEEVQQ